MITGKMQATRWLAVALMLCIDGAVIQEQCEVAPEGYPGLLHRCRWPPGC